MTHLRPRLASLASLVGAGLLALAAMPVLADNGNVPPGNPCGNGPGQGTGNPCNGNNGNDGAQGNAGNGGQPGFDPIEVPPAESTGVFITQIGTANRTTVKQGSNSSYAKVVQNGESNRVGLTQDGNGKHYAAIAQDGDGNGLVAQQAGTGQAVLVLAQQGSGNLAAVSQTDDGRSYSAAAIQQRGNNNEVLLVQDGSDNQARLTQDGDNNGMTANQIDNGNRLEWNQIGDGLADLQIVQTGGSTMQVTQSNAGVAYAPPPPSTGS